MDYGHWNIDLVGEFDPKDFFGFIYEIEEKQTGRSYIGKKFFKFKRKQTKSNASRTKDSDWKEYTSSSDILNDLIEEKGKDAFDFRILSLCVGRCQLTYEEQQVQFTRDVLRTRLPDGSRKYFNRTIGHLLFAGVEKQTEEAKAKIRQGHLGKAKSSDHCAAISVGKMGHAVLESTRQKISQSLQGRINGPRPDEVKRKISEGQKGIPRPYASGNFSASSKEKMIVTNKKPWWTTGIKNCRSDESPGPEWRRGFTKAARKMQ